jgi:hypothetical protein
MIRNTARDVIATSDQPMISMKSWYPETVWAKKPNRRSPNGLRSSRKRLKPFLPSLPPVSHVNLTEFRKSRRISAAAIVTIAR